MELLHFSLIDLRTKTEKCFISKAKKVQTMYTVVTYVCLMINNVTMMAQQKAQRNIVWASGKKISTCFIRKLLRLFLFTSHNFQLRFVFLLFLAVNAEKLFFPLFFTFLDLGELSFNVAWQTSFVCCFSLLPFIYPHTLVSRWFIIG